MALGMTKVAFGATSLDDVKAWFSTEREAARLTTRYQPKRHAEMIGGSVYWILKHQLVARSQILAFEDRADGRTDIVISAQLVLVHPRPRRAHQGWRYLDAADAPADLADGEESEALPGHIASELARLGLDI